MNRRNSLKHVQHFDSNNSKKIKEKKITNNKIFTLQFLKHFGKLTSAYKLTINLLTHRADMSQVWFTVTLDDKN